jgi:hypothetical protein
VNHTITLLKIKLDSNLRIFTVSDKYIPKYEEAIAKWKAVGIIDASTSHNPLNMFRKLKPNGEIRLLADHVPHNKIMVEDHEPILNQALILRTLGRAIYCSTIDLADLYLQMRVEPDCEKYQTIKINLESFPCKVLLQGNNNVPATTM